MHKCKICDKSFKSKFGLQGHKRVHSKNYNEVQKLHTERLQQMAEDKVEENKNKYYDNPLHCLECNNIIPYAKSVADQGERKFCNHSCSAKHNNKLRAPKSKETKDKISSSLAQFRLKNPMVKKIKSKKLRTVNIKSKAYFVDSISGYFSKICHLTCYHCKNTFYSRSPVKYCIKHSHLYKNNNRNRYAFTFSLSKYPDLFGHMTAKLTELGMWSSTNKSGLSRDHKVSVNEAILNGYDPYYIKHPLNCELMPWLENNIKKTKSSISYQELKKEVDDYESST